jgi:hypothetical protein
MDILTINTKSDNLLEKYSPTNIKDIIGCHKQKYAICEWLNNYNINSRKNRREYNVKRSRKRKKNNELKLKYKKDPNNCSCLIITGEHGTGKTAIVKAILNGLNYTILTINFNKLNNNIKVEDFVKNILLTDNIFDTINKIRRKKSAILIDELESISTPSEKNIIECLMKMNNDIWRMPIIFIGSNKHKKIMSILKKDSFHITIYEPELADLFKVLEKVGLGENMKFENEDVVFKIVEHCQRDYRKLIILLGELKRVYNKDIITCKKITEYLKYSVQKDIDKTIYENTIKLFSKYKGIDNTLKIFENDKTNMPLMIHQNYHLAISRYIKDNNKIYTINTELTDGISHGDIIDNYIYSEQNWNLQEMHGFNTCVLPSYKINNNINVDNLIKDSKTPYYKPRFTTEYPKDLNRTSTRCINYKNVKFANKYFNNMNIDDYVYTTNIINLLLNDNRIDECKELLSDYNLDYRGIMYVLRIDKINGAKKDISKTIEKKVKDISSINTNNNKNYK